MLQIDKVAIANYHNVLHTKGLIQNAPLIWNRITISKNFFLSRGLCCRTCYDVQLQLILILHALLFNQDVLFVMLGYNIFQQQLLKIQEAQDSHTTV